jgi:uncharacterized protein YutE (UPF0331/DUF86 family)
MIRTKWLNFRNRPVHPYWELDDRQLYDILQNRLDDFKKFFDYIARFLRWERAGSC